MNNWKWLAFIVAVPIVYALLVLVVGFEWLAIPIHFGRVMFAAAVLILYIPVIATVFNTVPPPSRDYLLAGILFTWTSAIGFAFWNEIGRTFEVDTSIFTNPIAGFFSLLLVIGGAFHVIAPPRTGMGISRRRWVAVSIGIVIAIAIAVVSPWLRRHGSPF